MRLKTHPAGGKKDLRHEAEKILSESGESRPASGFEPNEHRVLHELEVYRVELEMQNEELRQVRDRLEAMLLQYADLYEFSPASYFTLDRRGIILRANLAGANLLRMERSGLVGRDFYRFVSLRDKKGWEDFLRGLPEASGKTTREVSLETKQGRVDALVEGVWDEAIGECRLALLDITERRKLEDSLKISEQRYRDIVEIQNELVCRYLPDGRLSFVNEAYLRYYGLKRELALGTNFVPVIPKADQEAVAAGLASLTPENPSVVLTHRIATPGGETRWQQWTHRALFSCGGEILEYQAVGTDITERKRAEELRDQIERVIQHDLRTPACNAVNIAGMLSEATNLTEQQRHLLGLFAYAGQNMLDTLDSSLDLYKIELGLYRNEPKSFDCLALVRKMVETLTQSGHYAGVSLEVLSHCHASNRCRCQGEPKLLRRALQNLLTNALEASPRGEKVVVDVSSGPDCRIEIRNRGAVARDIRDRFFDKFVTKGKKKGTGLGAYSAKLMIEAQGGAVAMSASDEDNETVVTVKMPLPSPAVLPGGPGARTGAGGSGLAVLVVEDDAVASAYLTHLLQECGHTVTTAPDGLTALSILPAQRFDLVFMDVEMSVMDGLEAARRIRASGADQDGVPVIAMTAGASAQDRQKALAAGMDDFIVKPVDLEALRAVLQRICDKGIAG
ncbi:MAG: response regulator [Desulfovibrionaceae bacterium]|nr:response regulator [Desulfovibrionaceae bacterium]MBF0515177.1 response regulator [Desulfovibrionaceae bacterium]